MPDTPHAIITIDGPAGVGKSTLAKRLAAALGFTYLDTGAMFRLVAFKLGPLILEASEDEQTRLLEGLDFSLVASGDTTVLTCNGVVADDRIRTENVAALASQLAALPATRLFLKKEQQRIGALHSLVAEGRDMGTVVFAGAQVKFFLDATAAERARRRAEQLRLAGHSPDEEHILRQIMERDTLDRSRPIAPLAAAPDALVVDTTHLDLEGVFTILHTETKKRLCAL